MTPRLCYFYAAFFGVLYLKDGYGDTGIWLDILDLFCLYGFGRYGVHLADKAEKAEAAL